MKLDGMHQQKLCPNCGREIQVANFKRHYKACVEGYKNQKIKHEIIFNDDLICPFCSKQLKNKNSYSQHYIRCSQNPDKDCADNLTNYIINNRKGRNKYNCPEVAKQVATMQDKYSNGYTHPRKGISVKHDYIYQEQNQAEINNWLQYISKITILNNYTTISHSEGYRVISKAQIKEDHSIKLIFEHNYIANILLGGALTKTNCVHHINENRSDNNKTNLLIFVDKDNHKRYHNSKYAKLVYNKETHLFSCYIDKSV